MSIKMTWLYKDKPITELPEKTFGFVYIICYTDGTYYIGKKQCVTERLLPSLKTNIIRPEASYRVGRNVGGKRVYFDVVTKPMKWQSYTGSSKLTVGKPIAAKHILELATSKRHLTYLEVKYLFNYEVLEKDEFLNENIEGRYFKGNLI